MDINIFTQLVGSLGFPIVAFLLMYKEMADTRKTHAEEMTAITDALNRNTNVIEKLELRLSLKGSVSDD